jgi:NAD(P)H dehydrogenase (quinone)
MRVLVVYAHPLRDSFAAALRDVIVARLREGGHEVDHCDLCAEGFDPVLTPEERRAYNTAQPDLAAVESHVARLRAAEVLVLCFPTWWYGMPAILKGWFDRGGYTGWPSNCPRDAARSGRPCTTSRNSRS